MDGATRAHVAGKIDMEIAGGVVAMDISSIASIVHPDDASHDEESSKQQPQTLWSLDESGWPVDDDG